jgi:hypothetical protein
MLCPNCDCEVGNPIHRTVHEMWEVAQADSEEYKREQKRNDQSITVEMEFQGRKYRGVLMPAED